MRWAVAVQRHYGKGIKVKLKPSTHVWSSLDKRVRAAWGLVCASFMGCLRDPFNSSLGRSALGDKEWSGGGIVHAYNTGWWLLMVAEKSLSGALWLPMVVCTQAAHTSNKPCRIRGKGTNTFWGTNKPGPERAPKVFQIRDQTLRNREHGER